MQHTTLPKISCFCATFGRVHCLEEAIESFLRQDYEGEKEMVILNDFYGQTLHYDHPEVKVYNRHEQIKPLGAKFNATAALCTGDILCVWEDDDIYLSHRLSYTAKHFDYNAGMFHCTKGFIWDVEQKAYKITGNYFHCNLAISRQLFEKIGGYNKKNDRCDIDVNILTAAKAASGYVTHQIANCDIFYIYQWGETDSYHASGWGVSEGIAASDLAKKIVLDKQRSGAAPMGDYTLKPHFRKEYGALCGVVNLQ